jgi:hypothetical protein
VILDGWSLSLTIVCIRLGSHDYFPALGHEIMAGCIFQNLDQDAGGGDSPCVFFAMYLRFST